MTALVLGITGLAVWIALSDFRRGLVVVLVLGVLQDVLRKLTPSAPPYFILWSMAIFAVVVVRAWAEGAVAPFHTLWLGQKPLQSLWGAFAIVLAAEALQSYLRWGPAIAFLGTIQYIVPLVAVLFGVGLASRQGSLQWFLRWYTRIMVPVGLTVFLSIWFVDAVPVLRDVGTFTGTELIIYDQGTVIQPLSGLLRTGEIAAWHAATAAVFLVILSHGRTSGRRKGWVTVLIALLMGAIIFTGRRKMLMALTIFAALQIVGSSALRSEKGRRWVVPLIIALSLAILPGVWLYNENVYFARGASVFTSVHERSGTALDLARSAFARAGFFGLGLGVFSQGSRYSGVDLSDVVGGAGEAGIGRLILELGIPGLFLLVLLAMQSARACWAILQRIRRRSDPRLDILISLGAFIGAQLATFAVATEVFGDPLVLIILGVTIGCFIGLLSAALRDLRADERKRRESRPRLPASPRLAAAIQRR